MTRERMTTIWSLKRRDELAVRIYYAIADNRSDARHGRLIRLERVEYFDDTRPIDAVAGHPGVC